MCLIDEIEHIELEYEYRIGWKVFQLRDGRLHSLFFGAWVGDKIHFPVGVEVTAYEGLRPMRFYVFEDEASAHRLIEEKRSGTISWNFYAHSACIRKVLCRQIVTTGTHIPARDLHRANQKYSKPAFTCRHLTVLEQQ